MEIGIFLLCVAVLGYVLHISLRDNSAECKYNSDCIKGCECVGRKCVQIPISNVVTYLEHGKIKTCDADSLCSIPHRYPNTYTQDELDAIKEQYSGYRKDKHIVDSTRNWSNHQPNKYPPRTTGIHPSYSYNGDIADDLLLNTLSPVSIWNSGDDSGSSWSDSNSDSSSSSSSSYDSGSSDSGGGDCGGGD